MRASGGSQPRRRRAALDGYLPALHAGGDPPAPSGAQQRKGLWCWFNGKRPTRQHYELRVCTDTHSVPNRDHRGLLAALGGAAAACLRGAERLHQPHLPGMNVRFALSDTGAFYAALRRYNPREIRRLPNGWAELHFEAPPEQVPVLASGRREATHGRVALGPERSEEGACRLTELGYLQCEKADKA